jgi:hypothetical protein
MTIDSRRGIGSSPHSFRNCAGTHGPFWMKFFPGAAAAQHAHQDGVDREQVVADRKTSGKAPETFLVSATGSKCIRSRQRASLQARR